MKVFEVLSPSGIWHDYSGVVKARGFGWRRLDLNAAENRTIDKLLHRVVVARKRVLSYQLMPDHSGRYAALDSDLSQGAVTVRYLDLHGTQTKQFVCTSFDATLDTVSGTTQYWSGGSFTLEEV